MSTNRSAWRARAAASRGARSGGHGAERRRVELAPRLRAGFGAVVVGSERDRVRAAGRAARGRTRADRRRPGHGEDAHRARPRTPSRDRLRADPVHAGPDALRRRRHDGFDQRSATFSLRRGPVFANLLLADEINRTPPKTQAALLEAMEERRVTIDGTTHELPPPFMVCATQNPIEFEGTYPLPEAQLDRFFVRVRTGYPPPADEKELIARAVAGFDAHDLTAAGVAPVASGAELLAAQRAVRTRARRGSLQAYVYDVSPRRAHRPTSRSVRARARRWRSSPARRPRRTSTGAVRDPRRPQGRRAAGPRAPCPRAPGGRAGRADRRRRRRTRPRERARAGA